MIKNKYYYIKLKENFYDSNEIKYLESIENGYEYICILQKMYIKSITRYGVLMLTDNISYTIDTLSSVLTHKTEKIHQALKIFFSLELIDIDNNGKIIMSNISNFIGQSKNKTTDRNSIEYNRWRLLVFTRDNFICTTCGKQDNSIQAHHIKSWHNFPDERFNINNGTTLCFDCHSDIHPWMKKENIK